MDVYEFISPQYRVFPYHLSNGSNLYKHRSAGLYSNSQLGTMTKVHDMGINVRLYQETYKIVCCMSILTTPYILGQIPNPLPKPPPPPFSISLLSIPLHVPFIRFDLPQTGKVVTYRLIPFCAFKMSLCVTSAERKAQENKCIHSAYCGRVCIKHQGVKPKAGGLRLIKRGSAFSYTKESVL